MPVGTHSRALLSKLLLLLTSLVLVLFVVELSLRTTHLFGAHIAWTSPDPALGYRPVPGASYWSLREAERPISGRTNRLGYRDVDWSLSAPPGEYRIAVIGDSFVEAMQVEEDSTFLALTQTALSAQIGRPVELMNFGRSGDTQTEELLRLQRDVLQFRPDLVLLFFFPGNDVADVSPQTASSLQRPFYHVLDSGLVLDTSFDTTRMYRLRTLVDGLKRHSALVSLFTDNYVQWRPNHDVASPGLDGYLGLCTRHPQQAYVDDFRLNKHLMGTMGHILKARGIEFGIVVLPLLTYTRAANQRIEALDSTFDAHCYERDLAAFGKARGIDVLGLQDIFAKADTNRAMPLHWRDNGHWTYAGHRVVAGALENWLFPFIVAKATGSR